MKKTIKKLTAVGLTLTSVMGLVACGSSNDSNAAGGSSSSKEVTKPDKFTIMCDSYRNKWCCGILRTVKDCNRS